MDTASLLFKNEGKALCSLEAEAILSKSDRLSKSLQEKLSSHHFVTETVEHLDGTNMRTSTKGEGENSLLQIKAQARQLLKVIELRSILSEGLDLIRQAVSKVEDTDLEDYCDEQGIEYPELQSLEDYLESKGIKTPERPQQDNTVLTEEEVIASLDIKTRARLLTLNATAAAIGSSIHPEGAFAAAREELMSSETAPSELTAIGSVPVLTSVRPTVSVDKVDEVFFALQAEHRNLEAETNRIKSDIKQKIREDTLVKKSAYNEALADYEAKVEAFNAEEQRYYSDVKSAYETRIDELNKELEAWRKEELEKLNALEIVVPTELLETLKDVCRY